MSKRSRRERREGQARRAVDSNAPGALESLARSNPEMAAHHLSRALSHVPPGEPSPLDAAAEALCAQLRQAGRLATARELAAAAEHRSPRLRLEHALAAFALGDDGAAERAAAGDARVAEVMAPLLDAARAAGTGADGANGTAARGKAAAGAGAPAKANGAAGGEAPAAAKGSTKSTRKRPGAAGRPPEALAALHAAAAAVKASAAGNLRAARAALRRVPAPLGGAVLLAELDAAATLACSRNGLPPGVAPRLVASPAVRDDPTAREILVETLTFRDPLEAIDAAGRLGFPMDRLRSLQHRAWASEGARGPEAQGSAAHAALEAARTAGADAFDPQHRATACLYEGFALIGTDDARAGQALDRAVALGADMVEALRGKLLVALSKADADSDPFFDDDEDAFEEKETEVGAAADRLARAARHAPMGAPFAAAASMLAARAWSAADRTKHALASIEAARSAAGPALAAELDLREAEVLARSEPERALALLDGLTRRDPGDARVWRCKIALTRRTSGEQKADDAVLQAAEATRDPDLLARARGVRLRRGELAPFEGLAPGVATAGALAAEAARFLGPGGPGGDLPAAALACRDALPAPAKLAFDVAAIAAEVQAEKRTQAEARLRRAMEAWWGSPHQLARLGAAAWLLGLEHVITPAARSLAHREGSGAALRALFDAALAAEDPEVAAGLLPAGERHWGRAEARERRKEVDRLRRAGPLGPAFPPERAAHLRPLLPSAVQREIDAALAPEHCIADGGPDASGDETDEIDFLDDDDLGDELEELEAARDLRGPPRGGRRGSPFSRVALAALFRMLGLDLPPLTPAQERALEPVVHDAVRKPPTPARLAELKRRIQEITRTR